MSVLRFLSAVCWGASDDERRTSRRLCLFLTSGLNGWRWFLPRNERLRWHDPTSERQRAWIIHWLLLAAFTLAPACTSPGPPAADVPAATPAESEADSATAPDQSPPLPLRENLSLSDRANWRRILKWPDECESAFQASHAGDDPGVVFHQLGAQLSVVEVLCAAGSYQASSTFVRLDERRPEPEATVLRFPVYESGKGAAFKTAEATEIWGEISIDGAKAVMTVLNLARQTGDCGIWTRYDIRGNAPVVVDAQARLPCPTRARPPVRLDSGRPPIGWRAISGKR
jgi:hypothetical protein